MGNKDKNNGTLSPFLQLQFSIVHMLKSNLIILFFLSYILVDSAFLQCFCVLDVTQD